MPKLVVLGVCLALLAGSMAAAPQPGQLLHEFVTLKLNGTCQYGPCIATHGFFCEQWQQAILDTFSLTMLSGTLAHICPSKNKAEGMDGEILFRILECLVSTPPRILLSVISWAFGLATAYWLFTHLRASILRVLEDVGAV